MTIAAILVSTLCLVTLRAYGLARRHRRRCAQAEIDLVEDLIQAAGAKATHTGFDPALREKSARKRERAEQVAKKARRIVSSAIAAKRRRPAAKVAAGKVTPIRRQA